MTPKTKFSENFFKTSSIDSNPNNFYGKYDISKDNQDSTRQRSVSRHMVAMPFKMKLKLAYAHCVDIYQ